MIRDPVWLSIAAANLGIVFLIMLNGFLRGTLTKVGDAVLGVLIVVILILVIIKYGWLLCLAHIIGSFIFGGITQPLALRLAHKLMGRPSNWDWR